MANIAYKDGVYEFPAEGWSVWIADGSDWVEIPGVSDISITGAVASPVTKRSQREVKKRAGKPSPLTVNGTLEFWNPVLRGSKLLTASLSGSSTLRAQVTTKDSPSTDFIPAGADAAERGVTIGAPDSTSLKKATATVEGTETGLVGVEAGMMLKTGTKSYIIDQVDGTEMTLLGVDAALGTAATYSIAEPQLRSQIFDVHCTQAPGGEVTSTGSTEGESATGAVVLEAVSQIVLDFEIGSVGEHSSSTP